MLGIAGVSFFFFNDVPHPMKTLHRLGQHELSSANSLNLGRTFYCLVKSQALTVLCRLWQPWKRNLLKTLWKKEKDPVNYHFLLLPTVLPTISKKTCAIWTSIKLSSANAFNLDKSNISSSGKESNDVICKPLASRDKLRTCDSLRVKS